MSSLTLRVTCQLGPGAVYKTPIATIWLAEVLGVRSLTCDLHRVPVPLDSHSTGLPECRATLPQPGARFRPNLLACHDLRIFLKITGTNSPASRN